MCSAQPALWPSPRWHTCDGQRTAPVTQDATPQPVLHLGIELPLSGSEVANGQPTRNGVLLAIPRRMRPAASAATRSSTTRRTTLSTAPTTPTRAPANIGTLVADEATFGVVGPFNSSVARSEIPVSNEAGLPQCSPANTGVDLTKEGSEVYRPSHPDVRNYFRVATPDDIQGPADAQIAYNDLGKTKAFVVDDTQAFGKGVADSFSAAFEAHGGTIVGRQGNDYTQNQDFSSMLNASPASSMSSISAARRSPAAVSCASRWARRPARHPHGRARRHHRPGHGRLTGSVHHARGRRELGQRVRHGRRHP